jgi:hypothetical protein
MDAVNTDESNSGNAVSAGNPSAITSEYRLFSGGLVTLAGLAILPASIFADYNVQGFLQIVGGLVAGIGLMVLASAVRRGWPSMLVAAAVPGLMLAWACMWIPAVVDVDSDGSEVLLYFLVWFGILWASFGSILAVRLRIHTRQHAPTDDQPAVTKDAPLTRYQRLMLLATASGAAATVVAVYLK